MKIGLLHPGDMGVTVGASLRRNGHRVLWVTEDRSPATSARADGAGFEPITSMPQLVANSDAIVSVCPPAAALEVASQVHKLDFRGLYLDANAVAPDTAQAVRQLFAERYVDGGIIGPPALNPGTTRLYVSGPAAMDIVNWFSTESAVDPLSVVALGAEPCAASALKMCYAAYTKGLSALALGTRALAQRFEVAEALQNEWDLSQPGLNKRVAAMAKGTAPKAWRFAGEMQEIAATFSQGDLPNGFHLAAAEVYARMAPLKQVPDAGLDAVLEALLAMPAEEGH